MHRYEWVNRKIEKLSKFWEYELEGNSFSVRHGLIGATGSVNIRVFNNEEIAQANIRKMIKVRERKGYVLVSTDVEPSIKQEYKPSELETALMLNPDDLDTWQVYADYLQAQGEVHGELIMLSIALEQKPEFEKRAAYENRITEITEANKKEWLGLAYYAEKYKDSLKLKWRYGFIIGAEFLFEHDAITALEKSGIDTIEVLSDILGSPVSRFMQTLLLSDFYEDQAKMQEALTTLERAGEKLSLRNLYLGNYGHYWDISSIKVGYIGDLYSLYPNLKTLDVYGAEIELGQLEHAQLTSLCVRTGGLGSTSVDAIANAILPNLEILKIWFGSQWYGADSSIKQLQPLFSNKFFPKLKNLGLQNAEFQNDIVKSIIESSLLKQLERLDLSMGVMTDKGAQMILDNAVLFQHLLSLNLTENYISDSMCSMLENLFTQVDLGYQKEIDEYGLDENDENFEEPYLYVSVGE